MASRRQSASHDLLAGAYPNIDFGAHRKRKGGMDGAMIASLRLFDKNVLPKPKTWTSAPIASAAD
jgi:hypothetical protein